MSTSGPQEGMKGLPLISVSLTGPHLDLGLVLPWNSSSELSLRCPEPELGLGQLLCIVESSWGGAGASGGDALFSDDRSRKQSAFCDLHAVIFRKNSYS